jgi:hypothetical protein
MDRGRVVIRLLGFIPFGVFFGLALVLPRDVSMARVPFTATIVLGLLATMIAGFLITYGADRGVPRPAMTRGVLVTRIILGWLLPASGAIWVVWELASGLGLDLIYAAFLLYLIGANIGIWLAETDGGRPNAAAGVRSPLKPDPPTLAAEPAHEGSP